MASIREVAKLAGVSPSTVSRVINGTANVQEEKKQRVLTAIETTGFKPNELARALYKKSSRIIGVIIPNIENPFFNEIVKAIEEEAYNNEYRILLCNSDNNIEKEILNIQMLYRMNADGIILMTNSDKAGNEIKKYDIPVVVVDRKVTGGNEIAFIESDHYKGGKIATEHLVNCGCKKIVCIRGNMKFTSGQRRYQGYQNICKEYGIEEQYVDCKYNYEAGLKAVKIVLEKYSDVDGIIACNDMVAIAVYKVLTKQGYKIPKDIQIIGFDNIKFSSLVTPEITTVAQQIAEMGKLAARIIVNYGSGLPFQKENIFDVSLMERQTTKRKG